MSLLYSHSDFTEVTNRAVSKSTLRFVKLQDLSKLGFSQINGSTGRVAIQIRSWFLSLPGNQMDGLVFFLLGLPPFGVVVRGTLSVQLFLT